MTHSVIPELTPPLSQHEWFFVGGEYQRTEAGTFMTGQMYVEKYVPEDLRHKTPVVMIHGGVQTGSNFVANADGQRGWLGDFLQAGYAVYIIDQPERGRSGHRLTGDSTAPMLRYSAETIERIFTAPATTPRWPQARHHTQWPGTGQQGDPVFDRFFASQVEMLADRDDMERANAQAGIALLDNIGEAILLTHSQSGPFGWLIADARPALVKGILALEPNGPPFRDVKFQGAPDWFAYQDNVSRPYGITRLPMRFDPPVVDPAELAPVLDANAAQQTRAGDPLVAGLLPSGPKRRLPGLANIPILIVSAESSYHASYDQCTSAFFDWAGVEHDYMRLESEGVHGNGHMAMLESNSAQVSQCLIDWLSKNLLPDKKNQS